MRRGSYRVAGRSVEVSPPLPEIEAFRHPVPPIDPACDPVDSEGAGAARGEVVYGGPVWIGAAERPAVCRRSAAGYRIDIGGVGAIEVAADGSRALVRPLPPAATWRTGGVGAVTASLAAEAALGPALVLALALGGTFCLHASAVALPPRADEKGEEGGVVAFLGESGAGKSTLARLLDGARPDWVRAADDVLPVVWSAEGPRVFPRFPQLKVPSGAQPGARVPESLPLTALYLLAPPPSRATEGPRVPVGSRRLSRREAVVALVRNTVAARLFDGELLDEHLELCAMLAARLGVAELSYPWRGDVVPGLAEAIVSGPEAV